MTLYEIDNQILSCVDPETGEIIDEERLEQLELDRQIKISNVACWYKDLIAEADAIKAEKNNLNNRQKTCENKAEQLKKWLARALNGEKFKDARVSVSYRKSESVEFTEGFDCSSLPVEFQNIKIEPKKTELKNAINAGKTFDGVYIEVKQNIQIK